MELIQYTSYIRFYTCIYVYLYYRLLLRLSILTCLASVGRQQVY